MSSQTTTRKSAERQSADWDISNAPKNYISLVLTQGGSAFFSFASIWLITKYLGSEGYGSIVAVVAASQVAQVLIGWTSIAVVRFGVDEFIETGKIARVFWLRLIILLANTLLAFLTVKLWFPPLAEWLNLAPGVFWLVIAHFTITPLWIHLQYSFQALKMPRLQGALMTLERALIFTGLLVVFSMNNLNPFSALICYTTVPLLMTVGSFLYLRKYLFARFPVDAQFVKKIIAYSAPLLPFSLVGYFSGGYIDAVFVSKFLSTRDLGIYSVATQINGIALQLPTLANSLLIPLFITLHKEDGMQKTDKYFRHILPTMILLWSFFCISLTFAGYFFIPLILGAEFAESVLPLWILAAASVMGLPILIGYSALAHAASATYITLFAAIFSGAANITFNFLLIPKYGMAGCAWATVIAYFISAVTYYFFLHRLSDIPLSWTFQAMLPIVGGAAMFSYNGNPFTALPFCLSIGILVVYLHKVSLKETFYFVKNFRK